MFQVAITRRIDGKEYTITHKTDEHGNKETEENIVELGTGIDTMNENF